MLFKIEDEGFYSALSRAATDLKQERGTPDQMMSMIRKTPGVSPREIDAVDLKEFMDAKKESGEQVTKQELVDYIEANGVQIETVELKGRPGEERDQHSQYVYLLDVSALPEFPQAEYNLPGGKRRTYREILVTLPRKVSYDRSELDIYINELIVKYGVASEDEALLNATDEEYQRFGELTAASGGNFEVIDDGRTIMAAFATEMQAEEYADRMGGFVEPKGSGKIRGPRTT